MESNSEQLNEARRLAEATRKESRRVPRWYWPAVALGGVVFLATYRADLPGYGGWGPVVWAVFVMSMVRIAQRSLRATAHSIPFRRRHAK